MNATDTTAPPTVAEVVAASAGREGKVLVNATDTTAPPTVAEVVAASAGREGTMLRICRDAAAQIEENIRQRIIADAQALGMDPGDMLAKMLRAGSAGAAEPAKRTRAARSRPEAPADDATLLGFLLQILDKGRATSKGLAGKFAGLEIDRVRRVLADEASRGAAARVRLEPNNRTWTRVVTP